MLDDVGRAEPSARAGTRSAGVGDIGRLDDLSRALGWFEIKLLLASHVARLVSRKGTPLPSRRSTGRGLVSSHANSAGRVPSPEIRSANFRPLPQAGEVKSHAVRTHRHTSALPPAKADAVASSVACSGSSISLCSLPEGIIGKQFSSARTGNRTQHRPLDRDHLLDSAVEIGRLIAWMPTQPIGVRELDEIRQRLDRNATAGCLQQLLPLSHHAHILVVSG